MSAIAATDDRPRAGWTRLPTIWLLLTLAAYLYLGARPGGRAPIWVYHHGRVILAVGAAFGLAAAGAWSLWKRPVLQPGRARALVMLAVALGLSQWPLPYPTSRERAPSSVVFRLPVAGEWRVVHGGYGRAENLYSLLTADRRFALALVKEAAGETRRPGAGDTFSPAEFLAYGEPVLAAAAGRVVSVRDGLPDATSPLGVAEDPFLGNRVVLEVAPGEFLFTSHLAPGSIAVAEGDEVVSGQLLGRVGFSGRPGLTREPHVAVHLQTSAQDGWGEAIPWSFHDYVADGRPVRVGVPRGGLAGGRPAGQLVRPASGSSEGQD